MVGVNKAILIGHVGRDPEIKRTADGKPLAVFSLATSESWRDKATGERKEATEWHNVVVFNEPLVKLVESYVKRGSKLYLCGVIKSRKWQDQSGQERWRTEIVLPAFRGEIQILDRAERAPDPDENSYGGSQAGGSAPAPRAADLDDDIPF